MKIDIVKVCAGFILVLALIMSSGLAADTSWRHSGFTQWGYDINQNGLKIHNGTMANASLQDDFYFDITNNSDIHTGATTSKAGNAFLINHNGASPLADMAGIYVNPPTYMFVLSSKITQGSSQVPSATFATDVLQYNTSTDAVAFYAHANAAVNNSTVFAGNFVARNNATTLINSKLVGLEIDVEPSTGSTVDSASGGLFLNTYNQNVPCPAIQISGLLNGNWQNGLVVYNVTGAAFTTGSTVQSTHGLSLGSGNFSTVSAVIKNSGTGDLLHIQDSGNNHILSVTGRGSGLGEGKILCANLSGTGNENVFVDTNGILSRGSLEMYGEAYIYNNSVDTVIETADTPIALRQISSGLVHGWTFDAGSTGAITAYADGTGGTVLVSDASHGLSNGDVITIRGTTNYNGVFTVSAVTTDTFKITDTWVNDNGASDWDQGASLTAGANSGGVYTAHWQMTTAPTAAMDIIWMMYINAVPQTKTTAERKYAINDKSCCASIGVLTIVAGDVIWLSVESDDTANILNIHGNFNLGTV